MKIISYIFIIIWCFLPVFSPAQTTSVKEDRLDIHGGAVLTGIIEEANEEVLWLKTAYAGILQVEVAQVERVSSHRKISDMLPKGIPFVDLTMVVADKSPVAKPAPAQKTGSPKPAVAKKPEPAKNDEGWSLESGVNMSGKKGNTDKFDLTFTVDARLKRKFYRLDLYSRYTYGTNKGKLSSDEVVGGGRYTNFFFKNIGFFVREELEHDEQESLNIRSTSATGLSWKARSSEELNVEARAGISYRYDEYKSDQIKTYPGGDFGVDVLWKFAKWGEFKGSYTVLPSFNDKDAFILEQDSGISLKLDYINRWSVRFGLWTKYDNLPSGNRERTDIRYYARLVSSWK